MKYKIVLVCAVVVAAIQQTTAQNFDSVEIKTVKITETISMLEGSGGNIGVLTGNDGIVIIDDQFAPLSEKIKAALKTLSDKSVRFVINTHFHGDHVGGNENFGGAGAIIVAQDNTRLRMTSDQFSKAMDFEQKAAPYDALPKVTFADSVTLHLNGETAQVIHVKNAHTDGDAFIYFKESNVIHAGDVFVRYGLPFIDQEHGGSINGMIDGVDKLLSITNENSKIIPGHGDLAKKQDVVQYGQMLVTIRDRVQNAMNDGKTFDQVVEMDPTKGYAGGMDAKTFIKTVYDSLKK